MFNLYFVTKINRLGLYRHCLLFDICLVDRRLRALGLSLGLGEVEGSSSFLLRCGPDITEFGGESRAIKRTMGAGTRNPLRGRWSLRARL